MPRDPPRGPDAVLRRLRGTGEAGDEVSGDTEALAEVIAGGGNPCQSRLGAELCTFGAGCHCADAARRTLASDWLAAYVAAERNRAVAEALAPVRALADEWDQQANRLPGFIAYPERGRAAALRAALPAEPTGEGTP